MVLIAAVLMTAAVVLLTAPLTASANPGNLDPGARLAAFIEEFHEQGTFGSILDEDLSDALRHRLEIALESLVAQNIAAVCGKLGAFTLFVKAQEPKVIPKDAAGHLLLEASQVADAVKCALRHN